MSQVFITSLRPELIKTHFNPLQRVKEWFRKFKVPEEELGKNLENILINTKTSTQLSLQREDAARAAAEGATAAAANADKVEQGTDKAAAEAIAKIELQPTENGADSEQEKQQQQKVNGGNVEEEAAKSETSTATSTSRLGQTPMIRMTKCNQ
ncbi:GH12344 [Drosophila grimshawi]|uniref:GH12344 n=1 Tax=Drosophila grimshawi TaxID=7222 RepID=B4JJ35_DROGR|nr:GH12344 [Drosophila grimshawi]